MIPRLKRVLWWCLDAIMFVVLMYLFIRCNGG